jgi:hypothetical protein
MQGSSRVTRVLWRLAGADRGVRLRAGGCRPFGGANRRGWDDGIRLPAAADINPESGVVELQPPSARPGAAVHYVAGGARPMMWTFDGPGARGR